MPLSAAVDEKALGVWRRFLETTQRQEISARELVTQFNGKELSYSQFVRGLVAVTGSTHFAQSERKKLFESLRPNRDGLVDVDNFSRQIVAIEAALLHRRGSSETAASGSVDDKRSVVSDLQDDLQDDDDLACQYRDLRMRYRRDRLLAANLAFRTALLDRRPVLCLRRNRGEQRGEGGADAEVNAEIVWEGPDSDVAAELGTALLAPMHGLCGTIASYGGRDDVLLREAVARLVDEVKGLAVAAASSEDETPVVQVAIDQGDWTLVEAASDVVTSAKEWRLARLRVLDPKVGPCGELRLVVAAEDVDAIDVDDVDAWFVKGPPCCDSTTTTTTQQQQKRLSAYAARWAPQTFVYAIVHVAGTPREVLADLARRSRPGIAGDPHRAALESFLPIEVLRSRRAALDKQRLAQTALETKNHLSSSSSSSQNGSQEEPSIVDLIAEASKRLDLLEKRKKARHRRLFASSSSSYARDNNDDHHLEDDHLEEDDDRPGGIAALERACKKQRLLAWDRASRLHAALGRVQVVCRIRPLLQQDADRGPPPEVKQRLAQPRHLSYKFVTRSGGGKGHGGANNVAVKCDGHKLARPSCNFEFDDVWDEGTSQEEVFESVENLANDALHGRTASVFAYGCTGGGKSYTVVGDLETRPPRLGIAFQSVELLLASLRANKSLDGRDASVTISMVEVHNEEVYDLLKPEDGAAPAHSSNSSPSSGGLNTVKTPPGPPPALSLGTDASSPRMSAIDETQSNRSGSERSAASYQASDSQLYYHHRFFSKESSSSSKRRSYGSSRSSTSSSSPRDYAESESGVSPLSSSSRSARPRKPRAALFKKKLEVRLAGPGGRAEVPELTKVAIDDMAVFLAVFRAGNRRRATTATLLNEHSSRSHVVVFAETSNGGRLVLVDLAGCERVAKSGASGPALKEATAINKSLSALGDAFQAIDQKRTHVPYRNSKLTFLLSDVIGGKNSRCLFVFCCSPAWKTVPETLSCFKFAARMSTVQLDGDSLSDTQKQVDAIFAAAGDRRERHLLAQFLSELRDEEAAALKEATEDARRYLQQKQKQQQRETTNKKIKSDENDDDDAPLAADDDDAPFSSLPSRLFAAASDASELTDDDRSLLTTTTRGANHTNDDDDDQDHDDDGLRVKNSRVEREIEMLWRRLRATEAELATLRDGSSSTTSGGGSPPKTEIDEDSSLKVPPTRLSTIGSAVEDDDGFHSYRRSFASRVPQSFDIDELSEPDDGGSSLPPTPPPPCVVHPTPVVALYSGPVDDHEPVEAVKLSPQKKHPSSRRASRDVSIDIIQHDDDDDDDDDRQQPSPNAVGCGVGASLMGVVFCESRAARDEPPRDYSTRHPLLRRKVVVSLHRAAGLFPDTSSSSWPFRREPHEDTHPYAVCKYGDEERVTPADRGTRDPQWNADLIFNYDTDLTNQVTVYVFSTNTYTPDSLLGKCLVNFQPPPPTDDDEADKPRLLLDAAWLPVQPCVEHERHLLRHFDHDKAFGIHLRPPRFLFKKGSLGMIEVSAYSFVPRHIGRRASTS